MLKSLVLSAAMVLGTAGMAQAQTIVDGNATDEILAIAQSLGDAELATSSSGDPKIVGTINGWPYQVFFRNCTNQTNCEDLNFYAYFNVKPALDLVNEWNRNKRFGRGYIDGDLDAVVEYDVNLVFGVTRENLVSSYQVWGFILDAYSQHVGAPRP